MACESYLLSPEWHCQKPLFTLWGGLNEALPSTHGTITLFKKDLYSSALLITQSLHNTTTRSPYV